LHQHKKKLREERDMFVTNRDNNSMSKGEYWDDDSDDSKYSRERRGDPKHNRRTTAQSRDDSYSRNTIPQLGEEEEGFVQETPEAAPSRNTKSQDSRRQNQGKRSRGKVDKLQGRAEEGVQA
jgi:hypothetical protein